MGVNLNKGGSVSLTKEAGDAGLKQLTVGLGWDAAAEGQAIDLDASVVLLGADGKAANDKRFVYFQNLRSDDGSVEHTGDNLTGEGDGDDEQIKVDLTSVPADVTRIDVIINSYSGQNFTEVANLTARVVNDADNSELVSFQATDLGANTANVIARIERDGSEWKFTAVGEPSANIQGVLAQYGIDAA